MSSIEEMEAELDSLLKQAALNPTTPPTRYLVSRAVNLPADIDPLGVKQLHSFLRITNGVKILEQIGADESALFVVEMTAESRTFLEKSLGQRIVFEKDNDFQLLNALDRKALAKQLAELRLRIADIESQSAAEIRTLQSKMNELQKALQ